jgi:hypothetical protein
VNVFQLKTVDGYTHNGKYFLSDGTMTGDDLIGQLTLVIIGYKSVTVNIYGVCLDAGGSNALLHYQGRKKKQYLTIWSKRLAMHDKT